MDRSQLSRIAHTNHPIAAPLHGASVRMLLSHAIKRGDEHLLDLGCAEGAWLSHALQDHPDLHVEGVDVDAEAINDARQTLRGVGRPERIALHAIDANEFQPDHSFDVVLSVGATHAFGGLLPTIQAAGRHVATGGCLVLGDGFWEQPPGPETLDVGFSADEYSDLATTVDQIRAEGWIPIAGHVSTQHEWDDYEWAWTGAVASWALDHPDDPGSIEAMAVANSHRDAWLRGYRGTLGFVTLVLRRSNHPR
ncbi:SAM-dependent methyltransferase [Phytoactinopolyspora limicola]|uniref:SAM-dependent methyltransferase n=1 Tax=Phytoactinopolyspora limicola TaxID=2715536 RepID=UPI00140ABC29|nr:class I SAM-dependent methyltransferase [Phytoactinopolyspora limicola]